MLAGEEELCLLDEFYSRFITMATLQGEVLQPGPCRHWLRDEGSLSALGRCSPWALLTPHLRNLLVDSIPGRGVQEFSAMPSFLLISKWRSVIQHEMKIIDTHIHTHIHEKKLQRKPQYFDRTYQKLEGEGGDFYFLLRASLNVPKFP